MCLTEITVCTYGSLFEQIISVFLFRIIASSPTSLDV